MTMPTPRMTAPDAFEGKPTAFKWPIFFNCFYTILRTSGRIPTAWPQQRRKQPLVQLNDSQKQPRKQLLNYLHC